MSAELYVRIGFTMDTRSPAHLLIRRVTGGPGHVFIEFYLPAEDETFTYDCTSQVDAQTGKNGVRGPKPAEMWRMWWEEDPDNRDVYYVPGASAYLPLTQEEAWSAKMRLQHATHAIKYAHLQLQQNWVARRTGFQVSWRNGSPEKWTCSEAPVRTVIPPRYWYLLGREYPDLKCYGGLCDLRADFIVPGGKSFMSLEAGLRRIVEEHGTERP
jgi:hypothetical protein